MTTSIIQAQLTSAGLLIPRAALSGWQDKDIKFNEGCPLYEYVIEERDDRV
jgi:hypothetical protein